MSTEWNPVGWFEIPVTDMARAKSFYESVFEVELELQQMGAGEMAMFPMVSGGTGTSGSLFKGEGYEPSRAGVLIYFTAPDIEGTLARAVAQGGRVIAEKFSIGEYGSVAMFEDTEGNRIALHARE